MAQPGNKIPNENPSSKEKQKKANQLVCQEQDKESEHTEIRLKYMRLQKEIDEYQKIHELSVEREKKLKVQQEELEKMHKEIEKYKKDNNLLRIKTDEKEDSIRELQKKLDHYDQLKRERNHILSRLNSVAGAWQNIQNPEIYIADQSKDNEPTNRSEVNVSILSKDNKNIQDPKLQAADEKIQSLQTENASLISALAKTTTESEENVSILSKDIKDIQESKRQTDEILRGFQRENASLKSALAKTTSEKDSERQELLHENQRLQNEVTRLHSEKARQPKEESVLNTIKLNEIERVLSTKRKEIDSLNERIEQLENENMLLQKESDPVSKDRHNMHARNLNAADEVKLLQTEVEGKQIEIQRLQDKCTLDEKENKELQKKHSKVSEERDNLFQRNQHLQDELKKLNVKIRHLEENRMDTTNEWKHLVEIKDTVEQLEKDNDQLKQDIDTLSKENSSALLRYYDADKEVRHLQLDIKSKGEEIRRFQKQITQKEGDKEKLQERLSNISKEKQQLMERIKDLECVNANYSDQMFLATDESKRLQGRIKDLQGENSRLRRDIDDLSKQKEDALTRLSKVAGANLTHGNAAITDLSDTNRPTKLAEQFSELYDNAWTDAFGELDNTFHNEEETIKVLLRISQEAYRFCVETEYNYETRIGQAVFTLASKTESHRIKNANVEIHKVLADLRISLSTACCSVIEEMMLSKLPSILKSVDVDACPLTKLFARQCASLSWKMRILDPPLFVRFEFRCGSTFNADLLMRYTKKGGYLDFLVWPTLYSHESGRVLVKGLAQPKIAP